MNERPVIFIGSKTLMLHSPKLIVFDLGGVMVRIARTWSDAAQNAGIELGDFPEAMLGLNAFPAFEPFQAGQIGLNEFLTDLRLFLQLGSNESALAVHLGILKEPYPGTLEFVEELHRTGIRTACLSNTNAPHWDKMREFSLYPAIASIEFPFVSHELGMDKPGREIYDSLNTSTGFSGSELVFFDDTPVNVSAAIELEWQAFVIDPFGDPVQQMRELLSNSAVA